jgi:hypothetical protein
MYTSALCFGLLFIPHFYPVPHFGVARRSLRRSAKIVLGQSAASLNPYQRYISRGMQAGVSFYVLPHNKGLRHMCSIGQLSSICRGQLRAQHMIYAICAQTIPICSIDERYVMLCYVMVPLLQPINCVEDSWGWRRHATSAQLAARLTSEYSMRSSPS